MSTLTLTTSTAPTGAAAAPQDVFATLCQRVDGHTGTNVREAATRFLWEAMAAAAKAGFLYRMGTSAGLLQQLRSERPDVFALLDTKQQTEMVMGRMPPPPELLRLVHDRLREGGVWAKAVQEGVDKLEEGAHYAKALERLYKALGLQRPPPPPKRTRQEWQEEQRVTSRKITTRARKFAQAKATPEQEKPERLARTPKPTPVKAPKPPKPPKALTPEGEKRKAVFVSLRNDTIRAVKAAAERQGIAYSRLVDETLYDFFVRKLYDDTAERPG